MATIKSYTDVNQSKKLAEFLPLESADMSWKHYVPDFASEGYGISLDTIEYNTDIPCWSLAALLEIIPWGQVNRMTNSNKWEASSWTNSNFVSEFYVEGYDNPIDACYEMILTLKEKGLL